MASRLVTVDNDQFLGWLLQTVDESSGCVCGLGTVRCVLSPPWFGMGGDGRAKIESGQSEELSGTSYSEQPGYLLGRVKLCLCR